MALLDTLTGPEQLRSMSIDQLEQLAGEIRAAICDQVSRTGGHLAPNLGVVELTIAMHRVFDFGWDRLLFDVGHQCYPHKLLTGRLPLLSKLRTREGMAGFPEPDESKYDLFRVGHAGTGISTAVGMARGDALNGEAYDSKARKDGRRVVTIIGDSSIVNGVAMEGLNNAGTLKRQMLVVLNDNGMSIAGPQGALAQHFDRVRVSHTYTGLKRTGKELLKGIPGGEALRDAYHRMGEAAKAMVGDGAPENTWFEHFGLLTVGPIDGHHLPTLIEFLEAVKDLDRPCVLHVKTVKGKGFAFAEGDARTFHSPKPFAAQDGAQLQSEGCRVVVKGGGRSFTSAFGDALVDLMERDEAVVACTAAMPDGTGVTEAMEKYSDRVWDTGICESHALDMMAGLAKTGSKPFFAVYSTFLQRAYDQAFQEAALQGLPVRLCLDRAGLVGGDGAVHHGFADVSLLRTLPDAAIMAAIDEPSLRASLEFMRDYDRGLSSVRYPRDDVSDRFAGSCPAFELGKARLLTEGVDKPDAAILAFGVPALACVEVAESLSPDRSIAVYDARFAKPVDRSLLRELVEAGVPIMTVEEHTLQGGFGSAVLEAIEEMGLRGAIIRRLGLPDRWIKQDGRKAQLAEVGLDAAGIEKQVRALLGSCAKEQAQSVVHASR
ncbi:MAG: 1-deoxy-D-xylulose-5-phosphate synthase [Phycisphaerales bacterium]|jgi:1-deoxy-D-xylulose-5-phosphate synthase